MTTDQEKISITKYDLYYESRMTRMETISEQIIKSMQDMREEVREIRNDLKWIFGIMIGFGGIILGLMAHGFKWF